MSSSMYGNYDLDAVCATDPTCDQGYIGSSSNSSSSYSSTNNYSNYSYTSDYTETVQGTNVQYVDRVVYVPYNGGQQEYPHVYYRGNGGDLRVWDRPFDLVAASIGARGGVARTYTTGGWNTSMTSLIVAIALGVILIAAMYRLFRS